MITLKDIAKEAGVSVMTVSRVVNMRYSEVSEENIEKINSIINRLGYVPNSSARSLSSKSSKIISIIIQGENNVLETPYNATMLGYIVQHVQECGFNAMVHFINEYSDVTKHLQSWNAEGAIFLGTFDKNILQIQENNKIPLVFTDSYSSVRQLINIGIDDYKGGVLAARHFIENGHREFAFVTLHTSVSQLIQQRLRGFKDTIENAGLSLSEEHILEPFQMEETIQRLTTLKKPVTAIFAAADNTAIELMDQLKKKGYRIPEDFSIIGFDNLPMSRYVSPQLTTISQDIMKKAHYAIDILFQHLNDPALPTQNIILDVELIKRESVLDRNTFAK
ncbi:LacI family DNA-binding transcriptional regulator [Anaerocolumna xylanovorans]|uniref:Transcriptional regulator, LacI family n=1 Tax=Anaerocolumna xylanovorans DSM 12503 TaxID=1121345 RepID=A0A1M7Y4Y7_9FIRM|nr:LacI family DNA-binding transcriptional regulator [Anaerocolumna xylanovorans]SHO47375.1 transcriptional regulator, LacI family [Anaerocolumna xylanovorans DSM 12503]